MVKAKIFESYPKIDIELILFFTIMVQRSYYLGKYSTNVEIIFVLQTWSLRYRMIECICWILTKMLSALAEFVKSCQV